MIASLTGHVRRYSSVEAPPQPSFYVSPNRLPRVRREGGRGKKGRPFALGITTLSFRMQRRNQRQAPKNWAVLAELGARSEVRQQDLLCQCLGIDRVPFSL
jgi:hypothetical protein